MRVRFDNADATEIVLDRQTGDILEDEGRWRRVHFAIDAAAPVELSGLKTLLNIPGVPILLMSLSGGALWLFHRARGAAFEIGDLIRGGVSARSGRPNEVPPLG